MTDRRDHSIDDIVADLGTRMINVEGDVRTLKDTSTSMRSDLANNTRLTADNRDTLLITNDRLQQLTSDSKVIIAATQGGKFWSGVLKQTLQIAASAIAVYWAIKHGSPL